MYVAATVVSVLARSTYQQVVGMGKYTASYPIFQLEWTIPRIPFLTNGESKAVYAGYVGDAKNGFFLSRSSLADWALQELEAREWVGKAPALSEL